jgi:hypothetical protein
MGRRIVQTTDPPPPASWPDWLLAPPLGGWFPQDAAGRARAWTDFRRWQDRKRRWFTDRGMRPDWRACRAEYLRRTEVRRG